MKNITIDDWKSYFPYDRIRPEQEKAINFVLNAFLVDKKRYCLCEMGTGTGKSATAVTIARYLEKNGPKVLDDDNVPLSSAYVLTTQKILQQQYVDDFGAGVGKHRNLLLSIKSANNYTCGHYKDQSCAESRRILTQLGSNVHGTEFHKHCRGGSCPYAIEKQAFLESPISVTNFSYFLAETMYGKKLTPRSLLIIDECHNTEQQLCKFVEITFSEKFAREILKCKVPALGTQQQIFEWIVKSYEPALSKHVKKVEKTLKEKFDENSAGFGDLSKQYEMLDKHICKVHRFVSTYSESNWIINTIKPPPGSKRGARKFEFKAVDVSEYSYDSLFKYGGRTLMLSATVIDKNVFCDSIGLNPNDVAFISIQSPFPIENRPVHYIPAGSMSKSSIDVSLPHAVEAVKMLLQQHPNDKGMIHAVSFKIAQFIKENVKSDRILIHDSSNREAVLAQHIASPLPTVLISPSMMEGVDLADDASRFQILCKVPFPYLGDEVVKKRMARNKSWYAYQTVKSIIQSLGRSVRNETDHAVSYIIDSDWERFYKNNKHMFPPEFEKTLS